MGFGLLLLSVMLFPFHAGHQAFFTINQSEEGLVMMVSMDKYDLTTELKGEQVYSEPLEFAAAEHR